MGSIHRETASAKIARAGFLNDGAGIGMLCATGASRKSMDSSGLGAGQVLGEEIAGSPELAVPFGTDEALRRFAAVVAASFDPLRFESFWTLKGAFSDLIAGGFAKRHLDRQLQQMIDHPARMGDWFMNEVIALRQPAFALTLLALERAPAIVTASFTGMYIPLNAAVRVDVYALPHEYRNAEFDPSIRLELIRRQTIAVGEVFALKDTERFVYDFQMEGPVAFAKISTSSFQGLRWTFDRATLAAAKCETSEKVWVALTAAANVLGRLGSHSSSRALLSLAQHPHHAVRWAALQGLIRVNPDEGITRLHAAVRDRHPAIRRAAERSLARSIAAGKLRG